MKGIKAFITDDYTSTSIFIIILRKVQCPNDFLFRLLDIISEFIWKPGCLMTFRFNSPGIISLVCSINKKLHTAKK